MLARLVMAVFLSTLIPAPNPRLPSAPKQVRFVVWDHTHNGHPMASGFTYATVLPVVSHATIPLGTLVRLRLGPASVDAIVLDNEVPARSTLALSPLLARHLGVLPDTAPWVTLEIIGHEPRSRWIHAIGALTPPV